MTYQEPDIDEAARWSCPAKGCVWTITTWWTDEDFDRARREHKEHWDQVHVRELAEKLHRRGCPYDHTEGCPWSYEEHREDPWEQPTHKQYLEIARKQ